MNTVQPDMTEVMNQMILAVVDGRISEIRDEVKKEILVQNKPFLTVSDVSELTGLQKTTIYKYCSEGKIGFYRPTGKHTFFTWDNIREFVLSEQSYNKAKSEIRRKVQTEFINNQIKLKGE